VVRKDPGEVTLVSETALGRDLRQRRVRVQQLFLRARQAMANEPLMRRDPEGLPKGAIELANRQAAFARDLSARYALIKIP
jgi:hypothetical protein